MPGGVRIAADWSPVVCGRGLKRRPACRNGRVESPVVCGRGLKHVVAAMQYGLASPVVCGRGLKHLERCGRPRRAVARRVRAWIETLVRVRPLGRVARRVRAWIETICTAKHPRDLRSPVVCGRGLKQEGRQRCWQPPWMSPVVCGRGLKLCTRMEFALSPVVCGRGLNIPSAAMVSARVCGRGLKHDAPMTSDRVREVNARRNDERRRTRVRAWIET